MFAWVCKADLPIFINNCIFIRSKMRYMEKITFAPNVLLIDAACLNRVGNDMARHFAPLVNRELPKADLSLLLECLALDAGVQPGENEIQVIFIYDGSTRRMNFCEPSDLGKELHDVAFKSRLGEFSIYSFQPSGMASREDLFIESLRIIGESKEAQCVGVVPDEPAYGSKTADEVSKWEKKDKATLFGMNPPSQLSARCQFEMLGYAVLQSLGIRADEL